MQRLAGSCSPEQLHTLQKIFDLIWMELRANGHSNYIGPSDPDALREEIARRVLGNHDGDDIVDANDIIQRVLASFGIRTDLLSARMDHANGAATRDSAGRNIVLGPVIFETRGSLKRTPAPPLACT